MSFNYRESFLVFDPGIFSFFSLLNSISPFFSVPLSSIPAGNWWETGAAVFGGGDDVVVVVVIIVVVPSLLSWNVDRRREQKTVILKRRLSSHGSFLPFIPSLSPFFNIVAYLLSRLSYFSFLTRLRESHSQSITNVWLPRFRKMLHTLKSVFLSLSLPLLTMTFS